MLLSPNPSNRRTKKLFLMIRSIPCPSRVPILLALVLTSVMFAGCFLSHVENPVTRTETDYYTITDRDSISHEIVRNAPGASQDNGVVFPSSRDIHTVRN